MTCAFVSLANNEKRHHPGLQVAIQRPASRQGSVPCHDEIHARVEAMARFYGQLGGVSYAEPFLQKEVGLVEDLLAIPVKSV
jgi:hypothetical protein